MLAVVIGSLLVGLLVLLAREPGRFSSLMQRAFLPLGRTELATRTRITLMQPAKGHLTVGPQQKVSFQVAITGVVPLNGPDAPRLMYRYLEDEPWAMQPLEFEENDNVWTTRLLPDQVQIGLTYKIQAGDAETAPYLIIVQTQPEVSKFGVSFHYQPYMHIPGSDRRISESGRLFSPRF